MPSQAFANSYNFQIQNGQRLRENMLARQAGGMMADGDTEGARNALYRGGQLEAGGQLDQQIGARERAQAEGWERLTKGIGTLIERGMDPQQAWAIGHGFAGRLQIDPAQLEQEKALYDQNPQAWAVMRGRQAAEAKTRVIQSGRYTAGLDEATGKELWRHELPADAAGNHIPQGYRPTADGSGLEAIPGGPADPRVAGRLSASKRAPVRGRSGGGGRGLSGVSTADLIAALRGTR
jgi:hypothetical protein